MTQKTQNAYAPAVPGLPVFPPPVIAKRAPATTDINFPLGQEWVNQSTNMAWVLTSKSAGSATWSEIASGSIGAIFTVTGDSGGAESPSAGNFNIKGTANQILVAGSANTETLSLIGPYTPATYTAHGVLIGEGTSSIVATSVGTTGQVLIGSTGADPAFGALGVNSGLTAHGVLLGEGNSAIAAAAVGTTGQVLIGSTGADPAFGALGLNSGLTAHGVILGENNSAFNATAAGSNGQVFLGSTGADPAFGTLTTSTGVNFTTGAASLAVDVKTGGFAVVNVASGSQALAAQTMYITNNGSSLVTYTLPATVAQGTVIKIIGLSVGGWKVAQNAGQIISLDNQNTTTGTGGSISSTSKFNCIELVATDATTNQWVLSESSGTLTFV